MDRHTILLTGPPGAGKGTQSRILASAHGWHVFSIGQLLRDTADPDIKKLMDAGDLLPAEHVTRVVMEKITQHEKTVVVDGFPRRVDQAQEFDQTASAQGVSGYTVIFLEVTEETSWQRVKDRGRKDDDRQSWERRWQEYYKYTEPAVEFCRRRGVLIGVDGNKTIAQVSQAIEAALHAPENT